MREAKADVDCSLLGTACALIPLAKITVLAIGHGRTCGLPRPSDGELGARAVR